MSSTRLWLRVGPKDSIEWLCRDGQGRLLQGPGRFETGMVGDWPKHEQCLVVWADESLVLRRAPLPKSGRAKWRTGLPYLAEDWVAGDVADLHVAAPERLSGDEVWVGVVERKRLLELIERLRIAGLTPDRIIPEAAFLGPTRSADVLLDGGHASFVTAGGLGGGCEADLLPLIVGQPLETLRAISTGDENIAIDHADKIDSALRWLSLQPIDDSLIDLRQGIYAAASSAIDTRWWRIAAAVLLLASVVHVGSLALDVYQLKQRENVLTASLEASFREVFGPEARLVDAGVQIRQEFLRLSQGGNSSGVALSMLKQVAPLISSDGRLVLVSFDYRDGTLEIAVRAPDGTRFDGLREQILLDSSMSVEVAGTVINTDGFTGRMKIRRSS